MNDDTIGELADLAKADGPVTIYHEGQAWVVTYMGDCTLADVLEPDGSVTGEKPAP